MPGALVDTCLLHDYLRGDDRARRAMDAYVHRSISVVSWLELMMLCPPGLLEETRGFLRTFERLSVSEAVVDEALRLRQRHPGLPLPRATAWGSAVVNQLPFLTCDPEHLDCTSPGVVLAYRRGA